MTKNLIALIGLVLCGSSIAASAQNVLPLDSCRSMALRNNKEIKVADEKINLAGYNKKQASSAYLPNVDLNATYMWNQKEISLLEEDAKLPTMTFNPQTGSYDYNLLKNPATGQPVVVDGTPVPTQVAVIPKSAMTYDIHNVFAGAITITQPVFMGGKIKAMNEITKYADELARTQRGQLEQEVIYNVDAAYWQVVSLKAKKELAESFVNLLDSLNQNVNSMLRQGVATRSDVLNVEVKLNEAQVDLTRVENGLALSRMLLAQLCGMPINSQFTLADEDRPLGITTAQPASINMEDVYNRRTEIQSLEIAGKIYEQKEKVALSTMLPNLAVVGAYSVSNPNVFNGFQKKFSGQFSVGAVLSVPLWHWGSDISKYRAAKTETVIRNLELDAAREKIELQVNQASFKQQEAYKTYAATEKNLTKANENLRQAQLAFREGMMTADDVMKAQTAWLKANSEKIDAQIDIRLCEVYLSKVLGTMSY